MTEQEFFSLTYGIVIAERFGKETYYVIDGADVFGNGHRNPADMVYCATQLEGHAQVRISITNAPFWNIVGKIKSKSK